MIVLPQRPRKMPFCWILAIVLGVVHSNSQAQQIGDEVVAIDDISLVAEDKIVDEIPNRTPLTVKKVSNDWLLVLSPWGKQGWVKKHQVEPLLSKDAAKQNSASSGTNARFLSREFTSSRLSLFAGTGTAFVIHPQGYLLTNKHVVDPAYERPKLRINWLSLEAVVDGKSHPLHVIARHPTRDLALAKLDARNLTAIPLADSDKVQLGEECRVLGFPFIDPKKPHINESLKSTVGNVSGLPALRDHKEIMTDTAINGGNSGGPLLNDRGEVIGVATAKYSGRERLENIGVCEPINEARWLIESVNLDVPVSHKGQRLDGASIVRKSGPAVARVHVGAAHYTYQVFDQRLEPANAGNITLSPDGTLMGVGAADNKFPPRIYYTPTFELVQKIEIPNTSQYYDIEFSPDGGKVAIGTITNNKYCVFLLDGKSPDDAQAFVQSNRSEVVPPHRLAFQPTGSLLAMVGNQPDVRVVDVESGRWFTLNGNGADINELAFSKDGSLLATYDDESICIWDVAARRRIQTIKEDNVDEFEGVFVFTAKGQLVTSDNRETKFWHPRTGQLIKRLKIGSCLFVERPGAPSLLMDVSSSKQAVFHDADSGEELFRCEARFWRSRDARVSKDATSIAYGAGYGTVTFIALPRLLKPLIERSRGRKDLGRSASGSFGSFGYMTLSGNVAGRETIDALVRANVYGEIKRLDLNELELTPEFLDGLMVMQSLEELDAGDAKIPKNQLAVFSQFGALRDISLRDKSLTDDVLRHLVTLPHLERINIARTPCMGVGLRTLKKPRKLESLFASSSKFSDAGLEAISDCVNLSHLTLSETDVTDLGLLYLSDLKSTYLSLDLSGTAIMGTGVSSLPPQTRRLDFGKTDYSDLGMAALAKFKELSSLDLDGTKISSRGLRFIRNLESLRYLYLDNTSVDDGGLVDIGQLEALRSLRLSGTKVTSSGMASLANNRELEKLDLSGTAVGDEGFESLTQLSKLEDLNLQGTKVANLPAVSQMTNLEDLDVSDTDVNDRALIQLAALPKLTDVNLANAKITDRGMQALARVPNLDSIKVDGTAITSGGFEYFRRSEKLRNVSAHNTNVGDEIFKSLRPCPLWSLRLDGTRVRGEGLHQINDGLGYLSLSDTQIDDKAMESVRSFERLRSLDVANTQVTDDGVQPISQLTRLQYLNLSGTKITDRAVEHLVPMHHFEELDLSNTALTDRAAEHLASLGWVRILSLAETDLTDRGLAQLADAKFRGRILNLDLSGTAVTDDVWQHIDRMWNLRSLNIANTRMTPEGLPAVEKMNILRGLGVDADFLTNDGAARLAQQWSLEELVVCNSSIDAAAAAALAKVKQINQVVFKNCRLGEECWSALGDLPRLRTLTLEGCEFDSSLAQTFIQKHPWCACTIDQ